METLNDLLQEIEQELEDGKSLSSKKDTYVSTGIELNNFVLMRCVDNEDEFLIKHKNNEFSKQFNVHEYQMSDIIENTIVIIGWDDMFKFNTKTREFSEVGIR